MPPALTAAPNTSNQSRRPSQQEEQCGLSNKRAAGSSALPCDRAAVAPSWGQPEPIHYRHGGNQSRAKGNRMLGFVAWVVQSMRIVYRLGAPCFKTAHMTSTQAGCIALCTASVATTWSDNCWPADMPNEASGSKPTAQRCPHQSVNKATLHTISPKHIVKHYANTWPSSS